MTSVRQRGDYVRLVPSAAERRKNVAPGASPGYDGRVHLIVSRGAAKERRFRVWLLSPLRGWIQFLRCVANPGLTSLLLNSNLPRMRIVRASEARRRRAATGHATATTNDPGRGPGRGRASTHNGHKKRSGTPCRGAPPRVPRNRWRRAKGACHRLNLRHASRRALTRRSSPCSSKSALGNRP